MAKITTDWSGNSTFASAVKLSSLLVALNSTTVTLLGYTEGTHFFDNKNNTDFTTTTKNTTDFNTPSKNTTDWTDPNA